MSAPQMSGAAHSAHGASNRGLVAGALPGVPFGRFGQMFDAPPAKKATDAALKDLALAMIKADEGAGITTAEPIDENPAIPSGYTYFGQFVDHDITFDPTPLAAADRDNRAVEDFRSPALDLDSVYGRGPDDQPYLYVPKSGGKLRVGSAPGNAGAAVGTKHDVFRLDDKTPLLGDKRNDENKIVSQIHGGFIALHNKVMGMDALLLQFGFDPAHPGTRFRAAAKLVRWHYQWVVVHDYLERITEPGMVTEVLNPGGMPRIGHYIKSNAPYAYMPVEFAGAAFRFGHSQVRPSYALNNVVMTAKRPNLDPAKERIPTFSNNTHPVPEEDRDAQNLNGFPGPLVPFWGIDWSFYFDGLPKPAQPFKDKDGKTAVLPQPGYRIDALLTEPLADLPEFFDPRRKPADIKLSPIGNLAFRNLVRGQNLGLPSGQAVASILGIVPLSDDVLWDAGSRLMQPAALDEEDGHAFQATRAARAAVRAKWVANGGVFAGNAPLWYYVLREAEYYGVTHVQDDLAIGFGGQHLGPVGSRIVAETLVGLLWTDTSSFLHDLRGFRPLPEIAQGKPLTVGRLLAFALT